MRCGRGPLSQRLLLVLVLLAPPGDGNEGSITGNCHCDARIHSSSPPSVKRINSFRSHLKSYNRCHHFTRFLFRSLSVCGGVQDPWVHELMSCFDRKECGNAHSKSVVSKERLPLSGTPVPKHTEALPLETTTPAQLHLSSTQQLTLPPGVLPEDPPQGSPTSRLTHLSEATTPPAGHSVEAGAKPGESLQQGQGGNVGGKSAVTPVLSLLAISFFLTGVLLYVVCKRRRQQSLQNSPDLHLHYTPVRLDSNA